MLKTPRLRTKAWCRAYWSVAGLLWVVQTSSATAGPFGIDQGMSVSSFNSSNKISNGRYQIYSPARKHDDFTRYFIVATPIAGVCMVMAISEQIEEDPSGTNARKKFEEIREQINGTYGNSRLNDTLASQSTLKDPSEWSKAFATKERNYQAVWDETTSTTLKDGIVEILLTMKSPSKDSLILHLQYRFSNMEKCENEIKEINKETL